MVCTRSTGIVIQRINKNDRIAEFSLHTPRALVLKYTEISAYQ